MTNERWTNDASPLVAFDSGAPITAELPRYSAGYVRHLFRVEEMLGPRPVSPANLHFYLALMKKIREWDREGDV